MTEGAIGGYQHDANGKSTLMLKDKILTAGAPRVMQIHIVGGGADQGLTLSGYFYAGVRVVGTDDAGRITAMTAWPVLCGPRRRTPGGPTASWSSAPASHCQGW